MSFALELNFGEPIPLSFTMPSFASGLFVRADLLDSAQAAVAGSPFTLTEVGVTAVYTNSAFTPTTLEVFRARYVPFLDAGFTMEALRFSRDEDVFNVVQRNICHLGVTYDGAQIVMEGWLERDKVVVTPVSMSIVWFNQDGTILFTAAGPGAVDAQDHVLLLQGTFLAPGQSYYVRITITDAIGPVVTDRAIPFNAAPP